MNPPIARGLSSVPRPLLEQLLTAVEQRRVACPVGGLDLLESGFGAQAEGVVEALAGLDARTTALALRLVLAERVHRPPPRLDLVWSGPEARGSISRDTGLVVQKLFASATRSVLVGGYAFDRPAILAPLHQAMKERGVAATLFVEIEGRAATAAQAEAHATASIDRFLHRVWTFGAPRPDVYYDPRTAVQGPPWASLHAKCIVVDEATTLVTSANFTDRAQTRNLEVGVLIEDRPFAEELSGQWRLLIAAGLVRRYSG